MNNTYKALDVREYRVIQKSSIKSGYGCDSTSTIFPQSETRVIVIALADHSKQRVRFEFFSGYSYKFLNKTRYCGYEGDWNILVPGDYFRIEETSGCDKVTILT